MVRHVIPTTVLLDNIHHFHRVLSVLHSCWLSPIITHLVAGSIQMACWLLFHQVISDMCPAFLIPVVKHGIFKQSPNIDDIDMSQKPNSINMPFMEYFAGSHVWWPKDTPLLSPWPGLVRCLRNQWRDRSQVPRATGCSLIIGWHYPDL